MATCRAMLEPYTHAIHEPEVICARSSTGTEKPAITSSQLE